MKKLSLTLATTVIIVLFTCLILFTLVFIKNSLNISTYTTTFYIPKVSFIDKQLKSMTLRQKIASLFILHAKGSDAATLSNFLETYQPSGIIFMSDNIPPTLDELTNTTSGLQNIPELPYLFAMDGEGGIVRRLVDDNYPAANKLGTQLPSVTELAFRNRSILLKKAGINLNFGIVADITSNSVSFIYPRVFSGDPIDASNRVAAAVKGANGLTLSTLKHFPGHGETDNDSHSTVPITDVSYSQWRQHDNLPFVSGINAGAQFVMFGHLIYSKVDNLPASLSKKWHQILAIEDNFKGISITDDMIMLQQSGDVNYSNPVVNAINAIKAGNTMLLYVLDPGSDISNIDPNSLIDGVISAINDGSLDKTVIEKNARQILTLRHNLANIIN